MIPRPRAAAKQRRASLLVEPRGFTEQLCERAPSSGRRRRREAVVENIFTDNILSATEVSGLEARSGGAMAAPTPEGGTKMYNDFPEHQFVAADRTSSFVRHDRERVLRPGVIEGSARLSRPRS